MTLGEKIKSLRTQKGMTQEAFAEELNVSRSAIAKWESDIGVPEIINLKAIAKTFHITIDELLDEEQDTFLGEECVSLIVEEKTETTNVYAYTECVGYYYNINLTGWNDGVSDAIVCGEDEDFVYYQRTENKNTICGLIGKKHIASVEKEKKSRECCNLKAINREYFCNKQVCIEIAHKNGLLRGFFDFSNDNYLNVTINAFRQGKAYLEFGRVLNVEDITKIEEIITK